MLKDSEKHQRDTKLHQFEKYLQSQQNQKKQNQNEMAHFWIQQHEQRQQATEATDMKFTNGEMAMNRGLMKQFKMPQGQYGPGEEPAGAADTWFEYEQQ